MKITRYHISDKPINCLFNASVDDLLDYAAAEDIIIITDDVVNSLHENKLKGFKTYVIPSGEKNKTQFNADIIIDKLIGWQVNKNHLIVGVGGGVITDIAGYVASVYKRGTRLALMPTTILGMVDAALGGKNGVNHGLHKNMVGTIYQPECILFDYTFLNSLPNQEWQNGFAEIIKHACIKDQPMFTLLESHTLSDFRRNDFLLAELIEKNVAIKFSVVAEDERDNADRKLLNFGHTIGHAIENLYELPHGFAVSVGMVAASVLSEKINGFPKSDTQKIISLLNKYDLPVSFKSDFEKVFKLILSDKKREGAGLHFVLLKTIGQAATSFLDMEAIENNLKEILH